MNTRRAVVAAQIEEAMERRGMSRKQLADAMGRTPSEVTRWLSGNHNFTIDLLSEISEAVGVQITGVLDGADGTMTSGFGSVGSDAGAVLNEPSAGYAGRCSVGPIILPTECFRNLERRALQRGENLGTYVKGILLREAARPSAKAADFCGIWADADISAEDITVHRSVHRDIEEL